MPKNSLISILEIRVVDMLKLGPTTLCGSALFCDYLSHWSKIDSKNRIITPYPLRAAYATSLMVVRRSLMSSIALRADRIYTSRDKSRKSSPTINAANALDSTYSESHATSAATNRTIDVIIAAM